MAFFLLHKAGGNPGFFYWFIGRYERVRFVFYYNIRQEGETQK